MNTMAPTKDMQSSKNELDDASQRQSAPEKAVIAANRFSIGATPGDIAAASANPEKWLAAQLTPPTFSADLPNSVQAMQIFREFRGMQKDNLKKTADMDIDDKNNKQKQRKEEFRKKIQEKMSRNKMDDSMSMDPKPRSLVSNYINDAMTQSINAKNGLSWRLLDFFSNHFSVSTSGNVMTVLAPTLEREAIAPYLFGSFYELLVAVETHPAMLIYLNNEQSFGPNSQLGTKNKKKGLNENLAREILELHTLGVDGGYSQTDVIEFAKAITGWSVVRPKEENLKSGFVFRAAGHEPGARTVLGKSYSQKEVYQGLAILRDLSIHPSTAKHMSFKIARHFVSDEPPQSLVDRLTASWLRTGGNLKEVILTLINSPEAWQSKAQKYKTPREFVISASRACEFSAWEKNLAFSTLTQLGQRPFDAGSPAGYGDTASAWNGADALQARIEWAAQIANRLRVAPFELAENSLGNRISDATKTALKRAESAVQARTLLLLSPEFLRR